VRSFAYVYPQHSSIISESQRTELTQPDETFEIEGGVVMEVQEPFEPKVDTDFPTDLNLHKPLIPHIFHQTHKSEYIPLVNVKNVRSLLHHNPSWQYYFWTDETARELIKQKHPYLLVLYDNFINPVERSDLLRYVVLYEMGGVYLDTDVEVRRPLDRVTYKYACIIAHEPFEHASVLYRLEFMVTNAIMMCGAGHPFLARLLKNVAGYSAGQGAIERTGPWFVTPEYLKYVQETADKTDPEALLFKHNEPFAVRGHYVSNNSVYIPNSAYFTHMIDYKQPYLEENCKKNSTEHIVQRGCALLRSQAWKLPSRYEFTRHHWVHTWSHVENWSAFKRWYSSFNDRLFGNRGIHIKQLIPTYKNVAR